MLFFKPEQFLSERDIAVQRRKVLIDGCDKIFVYARRHAVAEQRTFQTVLVSARRSIEVIRFYVAGIIGGERVYVRYIPVVKIVKCGPAHFSVGVCKQFAVRFVCQLDLLAVLAHGLELHIRVEQHVRDVIGRAERLRTHGEQPLFLVRKNVRFLTYYFPEHKVVIAERGVLNIAFEHRLVERAQLAADKRRRRAVLGCKPVGTHRHAHSGIV